MCSTKYFRLLVTGALAISMLVVPATSSRAAAPALKTTAPAVTSQPSSGIRTSAYTRPRREVFGYFNASNMGDPSVGYATWDFSGLTTLAFFGLHVSAPDGSFFFDSSWNAWNSSTLTSLVSSAHASGVKVVPSILLHDFSSTGGGTVTTPMCEGLSSTSAAHTVGNIKSEIQAKGVDGVNIDYEGEDQLCPNGLYQHQMLVSLMQQLRAALPSTYISIATYNASYQGGYFDIAGLNPYVDSFFLMDYDSDSSNYRYAPLGCSTYCFSPTAPLNTYHYNDSNSIAGYLGLVPASKIILGVPYYGYTACAGTVNRPGPNAVPSTDPNVARWTVPRYIDSVAMPTYYDAYNYQMSRDVYTHTDAYATWYSKNNGCWRESYWDDTVSLSAKYDLVNNNNLRGVGIFTLDYGGGSPELWQLLKGKFGGCAVPALSSSVATPQPVGGTITFTSATSNCPAPVYAYWIQTPNGVWDEVRSYSSTASWSWNTNGLVPGTYNVVVWVKNGSGDVNQYDTYATIAYTFTGCASVGLDPNVPTPQPVGATYTMTGTTSGCPAPQYEFWLRTSATSWRVVQPYSSNAVWTWNTAGWLPTDYQLAVWVKQRGSGNTYDQGAGGPYTLTGCSGVTISPPSGGYNLGGTWTWTAAASGCPTPDYEFWIRPSSGLWSMGQGYSSSATFNWNTNGLKPGTSYQVAVWARQHGSGSVAGYDVAAGGTYTLTGCSSVSLTPTPASPSAHGSTISVSAAAAGCSAPQYSFWVKPVSGGLWSQIPYSSNATWSWNSTGLAAGNYYIMVWARQTGSGNQYDVSNYITYTLT